MKRHLCLLGDANSVHLRRWAQEMLGRGWRVSVLTARPQPIDGVEQRVLAPVARPTDWLWRVGAARRHLQELAPDLVHAHYVTSYGTLAAVCNRHPLVMTAWGSDLLVTPRRSAVLRWLTGWTLGRADLVTGDSLDLVAAIDAYRPRRGAVRIHWGADTTRFHPVPWAGKPGFGIASLRAWDDNYRIQTIVAALALLLQAAPDAPAQLHLLGGGPREAALRAQVRTLGLQDHVVFHGRVDDAAMQAVLAQCKVSVSVPLSDATSVAMLESMACGLPVLASELPANREWLGDNDGLWVPAGGAEKGADDAAAAALAASLQALWQDEARAQRLGQRNLARIQRDGRREAQMDAMSALYERLLADGGRAASGGGR
ncbi:MAG: glycosyltransferase [Rubrivivax sp.]|nr:glycosyltransferase [Rubrivivax sp.]